MRQNHCLAIILFFIMLAAIQSFRSKLLSQRSKTLYGWVPKADKWQGGESSDSRSGPTIPRQSDNSKNYIAKWQSEGDLYVSYDNLVKLDGLLTTKATARTKVEKTDILSELSLTYFARFHNIIREEYQFEKSAIETRLREWPRSRLTEEGFALMDLSVVPKGNLFQEKVYRFSTGYNDKLPFHRFGVGDSVRVTLSRGGDPLDDEAIDGVVLDRRQRYIDVTLRTADASRIDRSKRYRLDTMVNRVTFDRMIEALQLFLTPTTVGGAVPISKAIRDIMLYSYPNSMIQLANTPGGLKMALPVTLTTTDLTMQYDRNKKFRRGNAVDGIVDEESSIPDVIVVTADIDTIVDDDEVLRIISAATNGAQSDIGDEIVRELEETNMEENNIVDGDERPMDPAKQLQQRLETKFGRAKKVSENTIRNGPRGNVL